MKKCNVELQGTQRVVMKTEAVTHSFRGLILPGNEFSILGESSSNALHTSYCMLQINQRSDHSKERLLVGNDQVTCLRFIEIYMYKSKLK